MTLTEQLLTDLLDAGHWVVFTLAFIAGLAVWRCFNSHTRF